MSDPFPNEQLIDWEAIRTAAVAVGVREAARQHGADLSPDELKRFTERVMRRSSRQGWIKEKNAIVTQVALSKVDKAVSFQSRAKPLSAQVRMSAESVSRTIADLGHRTKHGLAKAAAKAADTFAKQPGRQIIKQSKAFRDITASSSQIHAWESDRRSGLTVNFGVAIGGMESNQE
jgi:hypothetical protein